MNKRIIIFKALCIFSLFVTGVRCGESESDKLEREINAQIDANNAQFKKDSLRDTKIKKAMDGQGLNYKQASEQVDSIYKF